jgi:hypothetical protein
MDPAALPYAVPSYALGPQAPYMARPAPMHYGDLFGADQGFSTVYQSGGGYDVVNGVTDADVDVIAGRAVSKAGVQMNAPRPAANFFQTAGFGVLLLAGLAYYIDRVSR